MKPLASLLFAAVLFTPAFSLRADVIFEDSFEQPAVTCRTPRSAGGDFSKADTKTGMLSAWVRFTDQPNIGAEGGSVIAGLTNQYAHKGKQSLFIEATKLSAPFIGALFVTRPIPVESGKYYKINLWGRNDPQKPLIAAMAQLFLKVQVEFFSDEGKTETGETQYFLQPLPGSRGHAPSITTTGWNPISMRIVTPVEAKFMVVSYRCDSSAEKGAITGTIYFDDFSIETDKPGEMDEMAQKMMKEQLEAAKANANEAEEKPGQPDPLPTPPKLPKP